MLTQITCPNCGTPYTAEIHQIVDARRTPELKRRLLEGSLNVAVCPNCQAGGQLSSIMAFHDPDHELFMMFVPQELHLNEMQREQMIGRLTQDVMKSVPPEERRAYMLQPQLMLNMQTFMEKVLETEGITKEMIERQRKQAELLNTLARADKDVQDHLIKERGREIDETFFAMLQQYIDAASQMNDERQLLPLINLRARLMTETEIGRRLERQQMAVHKLSQAAKKAGGLSAAMLAQHVVANQEDEQVVEALVMAAQGGLQYEFFSELSAEIEKAERAGDQAAANRLAQYRTQYLKLYDDMQTASRQIMEGAMQLLETLMQAPDKATAVQENVDKIDDAFMYVLAARIAEAEQKGEPATADALNEIQSAIMDMVEDQLPPPIQMINALVRAEATGQLDQLLAENQQLVSEELVQIIDQVMEQAEQQGQPELHGRLGQVKAAIQTRL